MNGPDRWVLFPAYSMLGGTLAGWISDSSTRIGLALSAALALATALARSGWLALLLVPGMSAIALTAEFYYTQNVLAGSGTTWARSFTHYVRDPILAMRVAALSIGLALVHQASLSRARVPRWAWALYAGIGAAFWISDGLIYGGWGGAAFLSFLVLFGLSQGIAMSLSLSRTKADCPGQGRS